MSQIGSSDGVFSYRLSTLQMMQSKSALLDLPSGIDKSSCLVPLDWKTYARYRVGDELVVQKANLLFSSRHGINTPASSDSLQPCCISRETRAHAQESKLARPPPRWDDASHEALVRHRNSLIQSWGPVRIKGGCDCF